MEKNILVHCLSDGSKSYEDVNLASFCPCCGVHLSPSILHAVQVEGSEDEYINKIFIMNFCPECEECFISRHIYDDDSETYVFESSAPMTFFPANFSDNVRSLSPNFVSVYNESARAESLGLTSICGMGYRKALEFLIKDYAISICPEDTEKISSLPLSKCIEEYVSGVKLKALAKASTWLGNDETHYVKKHADYGLPDMKAFITAFITYIEAELACQEAQKLLSK